MSNIAVVKDLLAALSRVLALEILEVWVNRKGRALALLQAHVEDQTLETHGSMISKFHRGQQENKLSRCLCKHAHKSAENCYWITDPGVSLHDIIPVHTGIAVAVPNNAGLESCLFLVGFSAACIDHSLSRVQFAGSIASAISVAINANDLVVQETGWSDISTVPSSEIQQNDTQTVSMVSRSSSDGGSETILPTASFQEYFGVKVNGIAVKGPAPVGRILESTMTIRSSASSSRDRLTRMVGTRSSSNDPDDLEVATIMESRSRKLSMRTDGAETITTETSRTSQQTASTKTIQRERHPVAINTSGVIGGDWNMSTADPMFAGFTSISTAGLPLIMSGDFAFPVGNLPLRADFERGLNMSDMRVLHPHIEGTNSVIYRVQWKDRRVVVKVIQEEKLNNETALNEFGIEFEVLSRTKHTNIVAILGCGVNPRPFIVLEQLTEMADLLSLEKHDDSAPSVFEREAFVYGQFLRMCKDLVDALDYLHNDVLPDVTVVHRDIKPENLGVTPQGRLKLFDFGLARVIKKNTNLQTVYKMTGRTGSLRYMAPEVALAQPYNERVDIYSAGIVLWSLASTRLAFRGYNRLMHHEQVIVGGERPPIDEAWPKEFGEILGQCWDPNPHRRPSSRELADRFRELLAADDVNR